MSGIRINSVKIWSGKLCISRSAWKFKFGVVFKITILIIIRYWVVVHGKEPREGFVKSWPPAPTSLGHALKTEILNRRPLPSSWKLIARSILGSQLVVWSPPAHLHLPLKTNKKKHSPSSFPSPKPTAFLKIWTTIWNHVSPETMLLLQSLKSQKKNFWQLKKWISSSKDSSSFHFHSNVVHNKISDRGGGSETMFVTWTRLPFPTASLKHALHLCCLEITPRLLYLYVTSFITHINKQKR